ncbi:uncharacterized protein [Amphiura filiformis]|uniref:uncharacterized protein n=1 Tax=Amphiura filiformis TaxID=82378 RepID=UPI003B21D6F0
MAGAAVDNKSVASSNMASAGASKSALPSHIGTSTVSSSRSSSYTDLAHEDLTCPLCFEFMVDPHTPKELTCPHVYCYLCLQRMVVRGQSMIDCPECRRTTTLPRRGIAALKTNLRLRSLAEKHVQSEQSKYSIEKIDNLTCPACNNFLVDPHTPKKLTCAHTFCSKCLTDLIDKESNIECPLCKHPTKVSEDGINALTTDLRLRNLAEKHLRASMKRNRNENGIKCPHHTGENMPFHCSTCSKAICQFCLLHSHRKHDVTEQDKLVQQKKNQLGSILSSALKDVDKYKAHIKKLMELEGAIESYLKAEEDEIDRCITKVVQSAQNSGQALKKQLRQTEHQRLARIRDEVIQVQKKIDLIQKGQRVAQADIETLTYENHTEQTCVVAGKLNRLCMKEKTTQINMHFVNTAKFIPQRKVKLGRVVEPTKLHLVQEFGEFQGANAIGASLTSDDLLIVNDFGSGQIHVYSYQPYEYKHKCVLELSKDNTFPPRDVAITIREEFLVARCTGVEVYSTDGTYKKTILGVDMEEVASEDATVNVASVTTTGDGRVLVGDTGRNLVTEHRSRTNRVIRTSVKPGTVAAVGGTHMALIDKYDSGSVRVQSLASGKETIKLEISGSQGICYDEKSDCMLLLRSETGNAPGLVKLGTGVLEQYCRVSGKLIGCLIRGLYHPRALVFTSEDMLAIADHKTIKIYRVNRR